MDNLNWKLNGKFVLIFLQENNIWINGYIYIYIYIYIYTFAPAYNG